MAYKIGNRTRLLPDEMKSYVVERYNGKSVDDHFPKNRTDKLRVKCVDCDSEYDTNNQDFINRFPCRCSSCAQKVVWEQDYDRLVGARQTDKYRQTMSESLKLSDAYQATIKERGKKHTKYWDSVRGFTKEEFYDEWTLYKKIVYNMTEKTYRKYRNDINPHDLPRWENHLDHKYSVLEGFRNNIPPYIICSKDNLEIIPRNENLNKQYGCSITKEELMNSFFKGGAVVADTCHGN